MPYMDWAAQLNSPHPVAAGTALANSTTLTDISPLPNYTLPANFLQNGSTLRLEASGVFSTTATPTLKLGFYYGGVAGVDLADTGAFTTPSAVTNLQWQLYARLVCRTTGTAGTAFVQGYAFFGNTATAFSAAVPMPAAAPAAVTIDTTTAKALTVGATWGTANAANTVTCHQFFIESVGQ